MNLTSNLVAILQSTSLCMINKSKIEELFHYFNIKCGIDSAYGNWAVSNNGDVVNYVYPYAITAIHLDDDSWVDVMRQKKWFKEECMKDLENA